jgi:hypothetical protein
MSLEEAIHIVKLNKLTATIILDTLTKQLDNDKDNIQLQNAIKSAEQNVHVMSTTLICINNAKISMDITRIACTNEY